MYPVTLRCQRGLIRPGVGAAVLVLSSLPFSIGVANDDTEGEGSPPVYQTLTETPLEPAGHIEDGHLRIDRFEFELTSGDLYLLPPIENQRSVAVYLGDGVVRCYPPDGVEHHQVERFLDEDFLEERFDRFVFWFADDTGDRLRALGSGESGDHAGRADDLLSDRRKALLEHQRENPDSRLLVDLLSPPTQPPSPRHGYFFAQIDGDDHGWFSIQIEPRELEEVRLFRFDQRRHVAEVWMGFHALTDFDDGLAQHSLNGFPRDPEIEGNLGDDDDDDWDARDLGLSPRLQYPDNEGWSARVAVPRIDVDLALEGDGDATASVALLVEPQEALATVRLQISRLLQVTDVRWRTVVPAEVDDVRGVALLPSTPSPDDGDDDRPDPAEPVSLSGEPLPYVQETHDRRFNDDYYEPWVTVALPRVVAPGERFILELAYEGKLVERLRTARGFFLKDTTGWIPTHPDSRRSRLRLTYRLPDRYQIASGMALLDEQVTDGTRIARWVSDDPVRGMSFSIGRFKVTETTVADLPITVYENRNQIGFAPGNLRKTLDDLGGSIQVYSKYFGPYLYSSLLATETVAYNGQAFPGFVLLSFQAFGQLHTGEAELFRAHEVAHQWWGAAVHWEHYRDQWLSEGFSHYSAALYTLIGLDREDQFRDILDAWHLDVRGEVNVGQGTGIKHYGVRPEVIQRSDGHESGPLVAGYRLNSPDTPVDYQLLVYEKGAYVLHMLRMMLTDLATGDDSRFRDMMRQFVLDHRNTPASTRSFEAAVTRAFGEPMDWFFDQWVYGVDIPTYRPELDVSPVTDQPSPFLLHGTIRQEDVPDTFRMPVPIVVQFAEHPTMTYDVWVDADQVDVEIPLPAEPSNIEFNYQHAVLAHVR